jgi:hypothetical protein
MPCAQTSLRGQGLHGKITYEDARQRRQHSYRDLTIELASYELKRTQDEKSEEYSQFRSPDLFLRKDS